MELKMFYVGSRKVSPSFINTIKEAAEVTAINNSSFDRLEGEKVWLYYENNTYKIVDALGLTSNAFTGKCLENINKGSSGLVSAVIDGDLIQRYTRDFTLYNSTSISVNDINKTLYRCSTDGRSGSFYGIYTEKSEIPTYSTSFEVQMKFKVWHSYDDSKNGWGEFSGSNRKSPIFMLCGKKFTSWNDYTTSYDLNDCFCLRWGTDRPIWNFPKNDNPQVINAINIPKTSMINNEWYWFKATYNLATETLNTYYSTDGMNWSLASSVTVLLKTSLSNTYYSIGELQYSSNSVKYLFDLAECYIKMDDEIIWSPYKLTTE